MDTLQNELNDLKNFIADLKADRAAQKEKEKREAWTKLERQRDNARQAAVTASQRGSGMGLAVSIFQISIAMGSICLVVKKKPLWHLSLLLAVIAATEMVRVWAS